MSGVSRTELTVAVAMAVVLTAIAVPNFLEKQERAREAGLAMNMAALQVAVEQFAAKHGGAYPVAADNAEVRAAMPHGAYPSNPYSGRADAWVWSADPEEPGVVGVNPATTTGYTIKGRGPRTLLPLTLSNER